MLTIVTTIIFKTASRVKNRVGQKSIESSLHQRILSFQIFGTMTTVLNFQGQRVHKSVASGIIDSTACIKRLGDVEEALFGLEKAVRFLGDNEYYIHDCLLMVYR